MQVIERCCERATRFQLANEVFLITTLVGLRDDLPSRLFRRVAHPRIGWVPQAQEAIPSAKVL